MSECWNHILTSLSSSVGAEDFKVWLSPVSGEVTGNTLLLSMAGSDYMAHRLEKKFGSLITDAASDAMHCSPEDVVLKITSCKGQAKKGTHSENSAKEGKGEAVRREVLEMQSSEQPAARQKKTARAEKKPAMEEALPLPGAEQAKNEASQAEAHAKAGSSQVRQSAASEMARPSGHVSAQASGQISGQASSKASAHPHHQQAMVQQSLVPTMPLNQGLTVSGDALMRKQWRYSFDDFVVGPSNDMATTAARDLCRPQSFVETLFVSSDPGLGKTHIVQSAVRQILEDRGSNARVAYLTGDEFYARFRMGLVNDNLDDFMGRVRALDFLLLDDIQSLAGKAKTQELLLSLVKHLKDRGSRVVFSSRFQPKDLKKLDSQLVSLVSSGIQTSMQDPDYEMRCEILRSKAKARHAVLPEEVVALLADGIEGDVRQLESCLQTLLLKGRVLNTGITPELAAEVLSQFGNLKKGANKLTIDGLIGCISREYSITEKQLCSCLRRRLYVEARNVLFYLARKYTNLTLVQIGARVNKRHSTVLKGIATIEHNLSAETATGRQTAAVVRLIERSAGCVQDDAQPKNS